MTAPFPPPNFIKAESTIEGITVYKPAPQEQDHRPVVEFKCPQCAASTAYSATDEGLTCTHCGYYEPPKQNLVGKGATEFEFTVATMKRSAHGWGESRKELQCKSCGVQTSLPVQALTHTCPFCNSNNVIQRQAAQDVLRPRFLIPFSLESDACPTIFHNWLGNNWMVPRKLQNFAALGQFNGIYLPYWTFDAENKATWKAEVGQVKSYYHKGEKKTKVVWRWKSGQVDRYVDDLLLSGTKHVSAYRLKQIENYDLNHLVAYEASYLAGYQAQAYDTPLEKAWQTARHIMRQDTHQACRHQIKAARVRNFRMQLDFAQESWRYILLPIYLAAYTYQDKVYQVMINAQTGAISGQRPISWVKVILAIVALLLPGIISIITGMVLYQWQGQENAFVCLGLPLFMGGAAAAAFIIAKAVKLDDE